MLFRRNSLHPKPVLAHLNRCMKEKHADNTWFHQIPRSRYRLMWAVPLELSVAVAVESQRVSHQLDSDSGVARAGSGGRTKGGMQSVLAKKEGSRKRDFLCCHLDAVEST